MADRRRISVTVAVAGVLGLSSLARADDFPIVNGLPCGAFCQWWLGVKVPPSPAASKGDEKTAVRRGDNAKRTEAGTGPRKSLAHHIGKSRRSLALARVSTPTAQRPEEAPADATAARTSNPVDTGAGLLSPAPEMTPPVAPAASVTPESHAVVSDPKAQPAIPADAAEKAAPPTPTPGPAIAAAPTAAGAAQPQPAPPETEATPATRNANEASDERKASNPPPSGVAAPQPVASETKAEPADPSAGKDGEPAKAVDPAPTPRVIAVAPPETQEPPADPAGDSGKASPAAPMSANAGAQPQRLAQVLIVMARPDVKDVADLRDKSVLVDGAPLISNEQLKASFAAAGASGAEFKHGDENDIERFVRGEFAAAVVGVVAPGLANYTREIPGFHLLRVEVSPPSKP